VADFGSFSGLDALEMIALAQESLRAPGNRKPQKLHETLPYVPGALLVLLTSPTFACTTCDSVLPQAVREKVLGPDFWPHIAFTILPFGLVLFITAGIHCGFSVRLSKTTGNARTTKGEIV
jgi:hypothetical protein